MGEASTFATPFGSSAAFSVEPRRFSGDRGAPPVAGSAVGWRHVVWLVLFWR